MKKFMLCGIVLMMIAAESEALAQWPFPRRARPERTVNSGEAPRPQLKNPDGSPVQYRQVQAPETFSVPAGTRVLMTLSSPLHTTSATEGSGVYMEVAQPVVVENRIVIPQGSKVQGAVVREKRPGRVKGRAEFRFNFDKLILPDNRVLPIEGILLSLPGSARNRRVDKEGSVEPVDQIDNDVATIATGAGGGALGGLLYSRQAAGRGAAVGGALAIGKVLFSRGNEIHLPEGTSVEMILQSAVKADMRTAQGASPVPETSARNKQ